MSNKNCVIDVETPPTAILIIIGILLVRSKALLDRLDRTGRRWQTALPLVSAVIVTLL